MKRKLIIVLLITVSCFAQNKQILYNFTEIPQSLLSNPGADVSYQFYFGVPLLSGISANVGSSGFSAYDLFADDGINFNDKLRYILYSIDGRDNIVINEQVEVFNGGFKFKNNDRVNYLSFGLYQEFDFVSYLPADIAILAIDGNEKYLGKRFSLEDLNVKAEMISVWHVGFHKKISDKLVLGGRLKLYSSGFNITSTKNTGYVYTNTSANSDNIYKQFVSSNIEVNTSGITKYFEEEYDGNIVSDIAKKTFLNGNLGLGADLGMTYYPKKNIQITASITDFGLIKHSKEVETHTYKGFYEYNGVEPNFIATSEPQDIFGQFQEAIPRDTLYNNYTTRRPIKINSSIQYSFEEVISEDCNCKISNSNQYLNSVGAQLFLMSMPKDPFIAFTTYYKRNLSSYFQAKLTYTIDSYSSKNLGLGFSTNLGAFNLYLMTDNLLNLSDVSKANNFSFQFGLNFIFKEKND